MPNELRIWDRLSKTDPKQTKKFTRAGGFSGTAIKPIYSILRMTEVFGPCGVGWGMEKPEFTTQSAADELLVFCTVAVWYMEDGNQGRTYGVGGDKFLIKQSNGLRASDEAYKMAYTDAIGNALKFIGVAADVHMGRFDDNKYIQAVGHEFEEAERKEVFAEVERQKKANAPKDVAPVADAIPPELDWSYNEKTGVLICRVLTVETRAKKAGGGEFLAIRLNGDVAGKKSASYFHETHRAALQGAVGKVCKFIVSVSDKGWVSVDEVIEVAGERVGDPAPVDEGETKARLLASTMELTEDELLQLLTKYAGGSWAEAARMLQARKDEPYHGDF